MNVVILSAVYLFSFASLANTDTAAQIVELKKQALRILKKQGVPIDLDKAEYTSESQWGDAEMTDSLYREMKKSFDEEELALDHPNDMITQIASPNFNEMPNKKWTMPIEYTLTNVRDVQFQKTIRQALGEIERSTCITFTEVNTTPKGPHLEYTDEKRNKEELCGLSPVGKQPNKNEIKLWCKKYGEVLHETLHSLGFGHTHERPDTDRYLDIHWKNIARKNWHLFKPWKKALRTQIGPFDYESIMEYNPYVMAVDPKYPTLLPKYDVKYNKAKMGQRRGLSEIDIETLNSVYCGRLVSFRRGQAIL